MALWTPAELTDLFSWWKADAITGLSNGDPVSTWADSHTGGYDVGASAGDRPTYTTDELNGLPVVSFNGSNHLAAAAASPWTFLHYSGSTVIAVWKAGIVADPNTAYGLCGNNGTASATYGMSLFCDDRAIVPYNEVFRAQISSRRIGDQFVVTQATQDGLHAVNTPTIISHTGDPQNAIAADRSELRINGSNPEKNNTYTGTAVTNNSTYVFQIGSCGNSFGLLVGYMAELVICDGILSDHDRQKVEGYLAHKWGLAVNLPSDHPYKTVAPTIAGGGALIARLRRAHAEIRGMRA